MHILFPTALILKGHAPIKPFTGITSTFADYVLHDCYIIAYKHCRRVELKPCVRKCMHNSLKSSSKWLDLQLLYTYVYRSIRMFIHIIWTKVVIKLESVYNCVKNNIVCILKLHYKPVVCGDTNSN